MAPAAPTAPQPSPGRVRVRRFWRTGRGWIVGLATFAGAWTIGLDARITTGGFRGLLFAHECASGLPCDRTAFATGLGHLVQGGLWARFLIAAAAADLTPLTQVAALIAAFAAAVGVLYGGLARFAGDGVAGWSCVVFVVLARWTGFPEFANPYMTFLPAAVFFYGLARGVAGDGLRWSLFSGLSLFCAVDGHVSFLVFLPLLAGCARSVPARPGPHLAAASVGFIIPALLLSGDAYASNLRTDPRLMAAVMASVAAAIALAGAFRERWLRQALSVRLLAIPVGATLSFGLCSLAVWLIRGWAPEARYGVPVTIPLACVVSCGAFGAMRLRHDRWRGVVPYAAAAWVAGLVVIPAALHPARWPAQDLTVRMSQILGQALKEQGWAYEDARRAEGPGLWSFPARIPSMRLFLAPRHTTSPDETPPIPRIVLIERNHAVPSSTAGWQSVALGEGGWAELGRIEPWVRTDHTRLTFERDGVELGNRPLVDAWAPPKGLAGGVGHLDDMPFQDRGDRPAPDYSHFDGATVRYEFDIQLNGPDAERVVDVLDYPFPRGSDRPKPTWLIESISGVRNTVDPSGLRATLMQGGAPTGQIRLIHKRTSTTEHYVNSPPQLFESRPGETAIRDAVTASSWISGKE